MCVCPQPPNSQWWGGLYELLGGGVQLGPKTLLPSPDIVKLPYILYSILDQTSQNPPYSRVAILQKLLQGCQPPPHTHPQILRTDREGMIDDVIFHGK